MMIVVVIIGALLALVAPSLSGLLRASSLSQEIESIVPLLKQARQMAIVENRPLEVRFFSYEGEFSDQEAAIRAIQIWKRKQDGAFVPATTLHRLAEPAIISEDPAITRIGPSVTPDGEHNRVFPDDYTYRAIEFRSDGSTNLDLSEQWYFTIVLELEQGTPPANFATIQIEPLTGGIRLHRP